MMRLIYLVTLSVLASAALFGQTANPPAGSGTVGDPYQIATLDNLYWVQQNSSEWVAGKVYLQTADIDASSTSMWNLNTGWQPIGTSGIPFAGTYDGNGKTIDGLFINRAVNFQGFFGFTTNTNISNLGVINVNIFAGSQVGPLAGWGGSTISNCYASGSVSGTQYVGGLVGGAGPIPITTCYSTTNVTGFSSCGGFVGASVANITNCYCRGSVTEELLGDFDDNGGFVGWHQGGLIKNCYSTGAVIYTGTTNPIDKGFVGQKSGGTHTADFWDVETSGQTMSPGTATGLTTALMKTQSTFLDAGWSDTTWFMGDGMNDGYPYLKWQSPTGSPLPIQLASLTAATVGQSIVTVRWMTASEVNNYGFFVERSTDSKSGFVSVSGLIPGHGTSVTGFSYEFVDKDAVLGFQYYRLEQIDQDNSVHYSDPVTVTVTGVAETSPVEFALNQNYPNPFNPSTTISYTLAGGSRVALSVYNLLGEKVAQLVDGWQDAGYHQMKFDAKGLASGMYIYKLEAGSSVSTHTLTLLK